MRPATAGTCGLQFVAWPSSCSPRRSGSRSRRWAWNWRDFRTRAFLKAPSGHGCRAIGLAALTRASRNFNASGRVSPNASGAAAFRWSTVSWRILGTVRVVEVQGRATGSSMESARSRRPWRSSVPVAETRLATSLHATTRVGFAPLDCVCEDTQQRLLRTSAPSFLAALIDRDFRFAFPEQADATPVSRLQAVFLIADTPAP